MSKLCYVVFDKKAATYGTPFFFPNTATALRSFGAAANDHGCDVGLFPSDFALYLIGNFDIDTGIFQPCDKAFIAEAASLVQQPNYVSEEQQA